MVKCSAFLCALRGYFSCRLSSQALLRVFASSRAPYYLIHAKTRRREVLMFVPRKYRIAIGSPINIPK